MFSSQAAKPSGGFSFGTSTTTTQPASGSLFSNFNQQSQQASGGLFGQTAQQSTGNSLFGSNQPQQAAGGLTVPSAVPSQPTSSLFNTTTTQSQPSGGIFGTAPSQNQTSGGLFGSTQSKPTLNLFGASNQQPQQTSSLFTQQAQPATSFGAFGHSQQQQQQQAQTQPQRPLDQTLRFGQSQQGSTQSPNGVPPLWEEGRGLGVYRSIPAQMGIIKDKWDPASLNSPLRSYLYQHVSNEAEALRYRPGLDEDEIKWEEAVGKRPGPTWVPLLVRGFFELGKKAQIQMEAIQKCNMMLQEINASIDAQLDAHRNQVATRLAECKRRHQAASQRVLALAVKVQILRNRGYVMDNAEEELKSRLERLSREIMDPSLDAREQEIWARMLGIRERAKRLKSEMDKIAPSAQKEEPLLDEETIKAAKQTLEAYDTQLRHLQKEVELIHQEFSDWEKLSNSLNEDRHR